MAPRLSGPTRMRSTSPASIAPSSARRRPSVVNASERAGSSRGCLSNRRSANASVAADEGSIHWSSSIASRSGRPVGEQGQERGDGDAERRRIDRDPGSSRRSSADSKARRRGAGNSVQHLGANVTEEIAQHHVGERALRLRRARGKHTGERSRAAATLASQRVDFPMPGSPSRQVPGARRPDDRGMPGRRKAHHPARRPPSSSRVIHRPIDGPVRAAMSRHR